MIRIKERMETEDRDWVDFRANFSDVYDIINYGSALQSALMRTSHRLLEKSFEMHAHFSRVLEIGAGTGEHLPFVRHTFDHYLLSDLDPKTLQIAKRKLAGKYVGKLSFHAQLGSTLAFSDNAFDRLVATHVLEHIYQPHLALREWYRVVKHGGVLSILIPTDPGVAWRLGRYLGPRRNALAQGIAYDYVMAREHVNSCNNLIALLRYYFPNSKESWWPFPISSIDLNLFIVFHITVNKDSVT